MTKLRDRDYVGRRVRVTKDVTNGAGAFWEAGTAFEVVNTWRGTFVLEDSDGDRIRQVPRAWVELDVEGAS